MVNRPRILNEFCALVGVDSLSYQERKMADLLIKALTDLGFCVKEDNAGTIYDGNCGNIYGYLEGDLEGEPLLFSAHMDTVAPGLNKNAVIHDDGKITSDGTSVLGADDLSGIVAILEAVRVIQENKLSHRSIEVLFTIAEEVYIRGSEVFDYNQIKSKEAYVLDLSGPVGTAALAAPTLISFDVVIHGTASHSGFAPELGVNAIAIAAEAISHISQGRIDDETTVNIGLIEGGKARNIVSDCCILKGEVRSMNHVKALSEVENIEKIVNKYSLEKQATIDFSTEFGCIAYNIDENEQVVKRFLKACSDLNYDTQLITTFGGSDNNNFVRHGIKGIVIACGMNQVHSCSEYTHLDELVKCCNIVIKLLINKELL